MGQNRSDLGQTIRFELLRPKPNNSLPILDNWAQNHFVWARIAKNRAFGFQTDFLEILKPEHLKSEGSKIQPVKRSVFGVFPFSDFRILAFHCTYLILMQYVKLNVGGSLHYTTIGTLTKHDNMLRAMFSGRMEVLTDAEGWILIGKS